MSANVSKGFLGSVTIKKTGPASGGGPIANSTEVTIPVFEFNPRDPNNYAYPPVVNKAGFQSVYVVGKKTPSVHLRTALMSWATPNWLNSLIVSTDANGDCDQFALQDYNGASTRIYDRFRAGTLTLSGAAGGGPIGLELGGLVTSAQGSTSFSSTPACVAGQLYTSAAVDFGATATLVRRWQLNLIRGNNYETYCDNSLYAADTVSGMLGGTLQLEQSDRATTVPSTTVTIRLFSTIGAGSPAVTLVCKLNSDEATLSHDTGFGNLVNTYTLIDTTTGGAPVAIS